jgi:hypothetical protein
MNQRIHINLATEQMKALKLRWSDPEVMMPRLFMSSTFMMLGGFTMVVSRLFMVVSC